MDKVVIGILAVFLFLAGCAGTKVTSNGAAITKSNITPAFVGAQTTLLIQGAEIAAKTPKEVSDIKVVAQVVGQALTQVATGTVVLNSAQLQSSIGSISIKGVDPVKLQAITKIVIAEYQLVAATYGFNSSVTVTADVSKIAPYVNAIAQALLSA